jgi:hypothetical protein
LASLLAHRLYRRLVKVERSEIADPDQCRLGSVVRWSRFA